MKELEGTMTGHSCPVLRGKLSDPLRATCKVSLALVKNSFTLGSKGSTGSPFEQKVERTLWSRELHFLIAASSLSRDQMPRAGISSVCSTALAQAGMQGYDT